MRWISFLLVASILSSAGSAGAISPRGVITCENSDIDNLPNNWTIMDQECIRIDLGVQNPGTNLYFDIYAGQEVDILMFPSNAVSVYQNEQSYRSESVWVADSVFESFTGSGEWHWETPMDRGSTRWYLVIDNLAHPQDSGEGDQGGLPVKVELDAGVIIPEQFTLADSIHRIEPSDYSIAHGPFSVDEGTFVEIHARTMAGEPDIFVMTESAFSFYSPSSDWSSSLRILSADMLLVNSERYLPWEASDTDGEDLLIVVDNRPGPGGGGAGTSHAAVTVTVTLTPVLSPTISSESDLDSVDVGESVTLSASETPNKSDQIPISGFSWDTDSDGVNDVNGATTEQSWPEPGNYSVRLSVTSTDSRSASTTRTIAVSDMSPPTVSMSPSGVITKGFGEEMSVSASFTDNWGVESIDWLFDGSIVFSNYSISEPTSTLSIQVSDDYSAGEHVASIIVTDKSGISTRQDVTVIFMDVTAPVISPYEAQIEVESGDPTILQVFAQDNQSEGLDYTWTFEQGTENEIQFSGPQVIYEFDSEGPTSVVCRVQNDAGLSSYAEILVIVTKSDESSGLTWQIIAALSVIALIVIAVASLFYYNNAVNRRMSELSEAEEEDESPPAPPSAQTQAQMWGRAQPQSFQPPEPTASADLDDEMLDILGASKPPESPIPQDTLEDSLLGDLESPQEPQSQEDPDDRTVRKQCTDCSKKFQITLPEGIDAALTNCPHCGSEQPVTL